MACFSRLDEVVVFWLNGNMRTYSRSREVRALPDRVQSQRGISTVKTRDFSERCFNVVSSPGKSFAGALDAAAEKWEVALPRVCGRAMGETAQARSQPVSRAAASLRTEIIDTRVH
jgi:hypothetical protein